MRRARGAFPPSGVLVGLIAGLLLPGRALAADLTGEYRGFSRSDSTPTYHPRMDLTIVRQDTSGRLAGFLTRFGDAEDLRFPFEGKVQDRTFKGRIFDESFGEVKFTGVVQPLGTREDMGVLARAHYKATDPSGRVDQGETVLLRSFVPPSDCLPPDPCTPLPMDWSGTAMSDFTGGAMAFTLSIAQSGTSLTGAEEVEGVEPQPFLTGTDGVKLAGIEPQPFHADIVGTVMGVDPEPFFVYVGVADQGWVLVGGRAARGGLSARYIRTVDGAVDLGRFRATPVVR